MSSSQNKSNKGVIALLAVGIAGCIYMMPWGQWLHAQPSHESRLTERIAEYGQLRQQEDWVKVYDLMDQRDRNKVPRGRFLALYGPGALKVNSIVEKSRAIDTDKGIADVTLTLDGELRLDRLPARIRSTLGPTKPEDLKKQSDFTVQWAWSDNEWWLRMDNAAVTGKNAEGKQITPLNK